MREYQRVLVGKAGRQKAEKAVLWEVVLSAIEGHDRFVLNVPDALHAICSTGKGRCWHCDRRLPRAAEAVRTGWDVQRVEGERVASIILVCPKCQLKPEELRFPARSLAAGA